MSARRRPTLEPIPTGIDFDPRRCYGDPTYRQKAAFYGLKA